jgi:two-component system, cell cycle response regulator DivK
MVAHSINRSAPIPDPRPLALLVGQDADTLEMYAEFLRHQGYTVEHAIEGREALAKAIALSPQMIVTDIRLPGIGGLDLCRLLRTDAATRDVPILIVTAHASERDVIDARAVGCTAVLIKPCLPDQLAAEIQRALVPQKAEASEPPTLPRTPPRRRPRRHTLAHAHQRYHTTSPPLAPPSPVCPRCDRPLQYTSSYVGGVNAAQREQWDRFACSGGCGTFQFRHRTRRLQRID